MAVSDIYWCVWIMATCNVSLFRTMSYSSRKFYLTWNYQGPKSI
jgi:hypothetical protein